MKYLYTLTRSEMMQILAGTNNCRISYQKQGDSHYTTNCFSVQDAQFYYDQGTIGGYNVNSYCCGEDCNDIPGADPLVHPCEA